MHRASLNHFYRLVWSQATQAWVAVAESCKGRGKTASQTCVAAGLLFSSLLVEAGPVGGAVTTGAGSIAQAGSTTTITQTSPNLSLNWKSFNVGAQETVNFVQPSAAAIAVNRIFDTNGSQILGRLNANGQVFLINPNGVLFGQGAQVNVGGLVASTLDMSDDSLGSASRVFSGNSTAGVVNNGTINAASGGYVALLGSSVINQGSISAPLGAVALGAGSAITLTFSDNSLVGMQVDQSLLKTLVDNGGLIQTDGGSVIMSAGAKKSLQTSVVNNTGIVRAQTVAEHEGNIVLLAGMAAGLVQVGGSLDASATGDGNGGFIETSAARVSVKDGAKVTTIASAGRTGTWLIDPVDFTIASSGGDMTGAAVSAALSKTNFTLQSTAGTVGGSKGSGDVNVNDVVNWSANKLTLSAQNNINLNAQLKGSGSASLALEYGQGSLASGNASDYKVKAAISLAAGDNLSTKLGSDGFIKFYTVVTELGQLSHATVASADPLTLQGMALSANVGRNFALGSDIDASVTALPEWGSSAGFTSIGDVAVSFTGTFTGLGHTVSGLTINRPGIADIGLFGAARGDSAIRDMGLLGGSVTGGAGTGGLLGSNTTGSISNSYNTGSVSGGAGTGGLIGSSTLGNISNSYATGVVTGGAGTGGLLGAQTGGNISNSYATGQVIGMVASVASAGSGGLVGAMTTGNISDSYATGNVTGGAGSGGFVGALTTGAISNSYATGSVDGAAGSGGLVGTTTTGPISDSYATGNVKGAAGSGGLVGTITTGNISHSYAKGSVLGAAGSGGLVGTMTTGIISKSYALGNVAGAAGSGGLAGTTTGNITQSFAMGNVTGAAGTGGLAGTTTGNIDNSFAKGTVDAIDGGGLAGTTTGNISNSYASGASSGSVDGIAGTSAGGTISNTFWNVEVGPATAFAGSKAMTSAEMANLQNFTDPSLGFVTQGWDANSIWSMGTQAPILKSLSPTPAPAPAPTPAPAPAPTPAPAPAPAPAPSFEATPIATSSTVVGVALSIANNTTASLRPGALQGLAASKEKPIDCVLLSLEKLRRSELNQGSANLASSMLRSDTSTCAKPDTVLSINRHVVEPAHAEAIHNDFRQTNDQTAIRE